MKKIKIFMKAFILLSCVFILETSGQNFSIQGFATLNGGTTGGAGGTVVTATNASELEDYCSRSGSYIIYIDRTISYSGMIDISSNKSILGVSGTAGKINGGGLSMDNVSNIIIQNITFTGSSNDAVNIENYATNIWIDHCDLSGSADGLCDIRLGASYVTVSWNKFSNQNLTSLVGSSDNNASINSGRLKVTYHHNWFAGTNQRNPRCRFGQIHVYNNYYDNIGYYGVASTTYAEVYVENNYFLNTDRPSSIQEGTSPEGYLEFVNNTLVNSGTPETNGSTFNPESYYSYSRESRTTVNSSCINYSGVGKIDPGTGGSSGGSGTANGTVNGTYNIIASHSGKALDVYAWGTSNGTNICQWDYWGGATQQFNIAPVDGEWHRITPVLSTDKAIDVEGISTANGANIFIWSYWGGYGQQFRFQSAGSGVWRIIARHSDKCIEVQSASTSDGANVQQWQCNSGAAHQMFSLNRVSNADKAKSNLSAFNVYPNPSIGGEFWLSIPKNIEGESVITVFDMQGKVMFRQIGDNSSLIEMNTDLAEGMYIINVKNKIFDKNEMLMVK